jgi:hypothetical protein
MLIVKPIRSILRSGEASGYTHSGFAKGIESLVFGQEGLELIILWLANSRSMTENPRSIEKD